MRELEIEDGGKIVFREFKEALAGWVRREVVLYLEPALMDIFDEDIPLSEQAFSELAAEALLMGKVFPLLTAKGWKPWQGFHLHWRGINKTGMVDEIVTDLASLPTELRQAIAERLAVVFWSEPGVGDERTSMELHVHFEKGQLIAMQTVEDLLEAEDEDY